MAPATLILMYERILIIEMFDNYPDVVTVDDLTKMLGIGRNTAYRLVNEGEIRSIRVGKIHKIPKRNVIEYLQAAC